MADTRSPTHLETSGGVRGQSPSAAWVWSARIAALAALVVAAGPPMVFTLMNHSDCYGVGPILADAVAWPVHDDGGASCFDVPLLDGPASPLARSTIGAVILWFLFAPIAGSAARVLGWLTGRQSVVLFAAAAALHLGLLALGDGAIGGAFTVIATGAVQLAPLTCGVAWFVAWAFAHAAPRAPSVPRSAAGRRWALVVAVAFATVAVSAWLFFAVARGTPAAA